MILSFGVFLAAVAACLIVGYPLVWALLLGLGLFFALGLRRGFSARVLAAMAWKQGREALIVVPVFLLIGVVTALWRASGTISFFLYYGLRGIAPGFFLLAAFLLSAALSFALGTSYGVTGTAGVVLITLARSGGVDLAMAAGAILSGAYFGDRCSPMSSCATLVAACTQTRLYDNVREMLKTAALPTVLTVAVFALASVQNPMSAVDGSVLSALSEGFALHWSVLLPAAPMLILPLLRVPVKWAMAISAAIALVLTVILLITSLYAGILEGIDALAPAKTHVERLAGRLGLFPATALVSTALVMVFCNQAVTVMLDTQLLADSYAIRGASRTELAMDIANSGVVIAGLVPWSIAITVPLSMLGVGIEAIPWCVLLYLIPFCYLVTKRYFRAGQNLPALSERTTV